MVLSIITAILLTVAVYLTLTSTLRAIRRIRRLSRVTVRFKVGDRVYDYTPEMTPKKFANLIEEDFEKRSLGGARQAVHS